MNPCFLLSFNQALVLVFRDRSPQVRIQLLLFEMKILFGLGELSSNRVDHDFLLFHDGQKRCLLAKGSLDFVGLSLTLELYLAEVVLKALNLEPELIVFRLVDSPVISLLFDILGVLN